MDPDSQLADSRLIDSSSLLDYLKLRGYDHSVITQLSQLLTYKKVCYVFTNGSQILEVIGLTMKMSKAIIDEEEF